MKVLGASAGAVTWLNEWVGRITAHLVLFMFVFLFVEVVLRYFFRAPSNWTGELSQLLFGVYALLGGGYLLINNGHVNVDLIYGRWSRRTRAAVDIATSMLFFVFVIVLLWQGWSLAADSVARWETSQSAWNPPVWPVKVIIPISAALLLLQGLVKLANDILIVAGHEPIVPDAKPHDGAGDTL
ncbi:MAG: TRAP transporter small permease subunit [Aliihoeflea sp.]|uniref:TRAP transporter small permease subunit n=1 Tax=Aliihoeflea sp. TaxID=2608088 RepID=UPI0040333DF9